MSVYNIIWADDEIDDFLDDNFQFILSCKGFNVIGMAHNGEELERCLQSTEDIDAVIVDANFNETSSDVSNDRDISGFLYARSLYYHRLNKKIPFFLYTNRAEELLQDITRDNPSYLKDFPRHKRWFSKHDLNERDEMFEEIKKEVEKRNTPEFRIRNSFSQEFEAAELIDGAQQLLLEGLSFTYSDNWKVVQDYFNPVRKIIERIFSKLIDRKILPPIKSLNKMSKLLSQQEYEDSECKYILKKPLMHPTLAHSLKYCIDITQDGSHSSGNLRIKVDEYARKTRNTNLYNSILYVVMDLLLWYKEISNNTKLSGCNWEGRIKYEYIGKLYLSFDKRYWYSGVYEIQNDRNLKEGAKIVIYSSTPNKISRNGITKFVPKGSYSIIEE